MMYSHSYQCAIGGGLRAFQTASVLQKAKKGVLQLRAQDGGHHRKDGVVIRLHRLRLGVSQRGHAQGPKCL